MRTLFASLARRFARLQFRDARPELLTAVFA